MGNCLFKDVQSGKTHWGSNLSTGLGPWGPRQHCGWKGRLIQSPALGVDFGVSQWLCGYLEASGSSGRATSRQHLNKCLPGGIL